MTIRAVVDARKTRLDAEAAWQLLQGASTITTVRGKSVHHWDPRTDAQATILREVMGPSGNLRAPALRAGNEFIVGFQAELYRKWLGTRG